MNAFWCFFVYGWFLGGDFQFCFRFLWFLDGFCVFLFLFLDGIWMVFGGFGVVFNGFCISPKCILDVLVAGNLSAFFSRVL